MVVEEMNGWQLLMGYQTINSILISQIVSFIISSIHLIGKFDGCNVVMKTTKHR